jgi:HlyD family secretion protein
MAAPDDTLPTPTADPEVLAVLGLADRSQRKRRRILRWAIIAVCLVGIGFGVSRYLRARAEAQKPVWKSEVIKRGDIRVTVSATGTLEGLNTVEVGTEVSGKLTKVLVDFNDHVHVGQVLAVIDPEQSQAAVDEAAAQVAQADASIFQNRATLVEAKQKLDRAKGQLEAGLIATQDFEALQAEWARADASVKSANASATLSRASLKSAKSRLEKTTIVSPIDGIVLSRLVESGQTVTAGMTTPVLFKLAQDLRLMSLSVMVDEADIGRVREGQEASFTVDTYADKVFPSKVLSVRNDPVTTQNVVTYEAILSANNDDSLLRPGMTAAATIVIQTQHGALCLPNAALRFAPSSDVQAQLRLPGVPSGPRKATFATKHEPQVWIEKDGLPAPVSVTTGASDGAFTELLGGPLNEGSKVIVDVEERKK